MKRIAVTALLAVLTGCSSNDALVVSIDCGEHNDRNIRMVINGEQRTGCPQNFTMAPGHLVVEAKKNLDDGSYLEGRAERTVSERIERVPLELERVLTEEYYYRKADTIAGMHEYLRHQPKGKRRDEISERLEQTYWEGARDVAGIRAYLNNLPQGKRREEVEQRLEPAYYAAAADIPGMEAYLENLPEGERRDEILSRLQEAFSGAIYEDPDNGLQWMRCSLGQEWDGQRCRGVADRFAWDEIRQMLSDFSYGGYQDWRLPSRDEMLTLIHCSSEEGGERGMRCRGNYSRPTIDQEAFPDTPPAEFWTSTRDDEEPARAWHISFYDAGARRDDMEYGRNVRLVRGEARDRVRLRTVE